MNLHFRRWGWLCGVCAFVVLWPLVLWRLQRIPPLDETTIRRAAEELDRQIEREYGPSIWKKYQAFDKKFEEEGSLVGNPRFERLSLNYLNVNSASSIMKEEIDSLREQYEARFKEWDSLVQQGITNIPITDILLSNLDTDSKHWIPNFLHLQSMAKTRRAMAVQSMSEGDWDSALSQLRSGAHVSDPACVNSLIGYLIHVASRGIGYSAYNQLLWAEAPVEVQKQALRDLLSLRNTEPRFHRILRKLEDFTIFSGFYLGSRTPGLISSLFLIHQSIDRAVSSREQFRSSRLMDWASRYARKTSDESNSFLGFNRVIDRNQVKWTTIPSFVRWLKETAESEPAIFADLGNSQELLDSGDPWTLALMNGGWLPDDNWNVANTRGRIAVTRGRLLEAAFAARIYQHDRGGWPEDVSDLIPDYIPNLGSEEEQSNETGPYLPLQIAWLDIDEQTRQMLWQENLPMRSIRQLSIESRSDNRQTVLTGYGRSQDWLNQPVIPIAVAQEFRAHPKLVADARVWMCTEPIAYSGATGIYPRELIDRLPWKPIDLEYARRLTIEYDKGASAREEERWRRVGNLDMDGMFQVMSATREQPLYSNTSIRFWANLCAPEKALVIWSPGPDGVDDGGRIVYDPTNGTISGGDLVVFPEGY